MSCDSGNTQTPRAGRAEFVYGTLGVKGRLLVCCDEYGNGVNLIPIIFDLMIGLNELREEVRRLKTFCLFRTENVSANAVCAQP